MSMRVSVSELWSCSWTPLQLILLEIGRASSRRKPSDQYCSVSCRAHRKVVQIRQEDFVLTDVSQALSIG